MYGIYKITQLKAENSSLLISLKDGVQELTALATPLSLCVDFSDMLIKLGMYDNKNLTFNNGTSIPTELVGVIEVEVNIDTNSQYEGADKEISTIELTPAGYVHVRKYLANPPVITNKYNKDEVKEIETPDSDPYNSYDGKPKVTGKVVKVLDGDTIHLEIISQENSHITTGTITVRFLGVNTPEIKHEGETEANNQEWANKYGVSKDEVDKLGVAAQEYTTNTLLNKEVDVYLDTYDSGNGEGRDKYGRYLGIVFLKDATSTININKTLLRKGLADVMVLTSGGKVMSNYPINIWTQYSPYYTHIRTSNEEKAVEEANRRKSTDLNRDMAGMLPYSSPTRRVGTIGNYTPRYSPGTEGTPNGGETPEDLANRFGVTVKELLEFNNIPEGYAYKTVDELYDAGWFDTKISIPVYDTPEDYYNVKIVPADEDVTPDNPWRYDPPEKDYNDIPCAETDETMALPDIRTPYHVRIGDVEFVIPPTAIRITETAANNSVKALRTRSSIKTQSGYMNRALELQLFFHNISAINGYAIENKDVNAADPHYYINGLRPLLAEFKKTPFVPIDNSYINETLGIMNIALQNIMIQTVPGFPNTIQATVQLIPFNHYPLLPQYEKFSDAINWPMFRWHYQQTMQPATQARKSSHTFLKPISSVDHSFQFSLADEAQLSYRKDLINNLRNLVLPSSYTKQQTDGDNEAGRLLRMANMLKLGEQQRDRYIAAQYHLRVVDSNNVTKELAKEINNRIYNPGEQHVFLYPGYFMSYTSKELSPLSGLSQSGMVKNWEERIDNIMSGTISAKAAQCYVLYIESNFAQDEAVRYEINKNELTGVYMYKWKTAGKPYTIPCSDTALIEALKEFSNPFEQDVINYKKEYEAKQQIIFGLEQELSLVPQRVDNFIVTDMQASYSNLFSAQQVQLEQEPSLQHLGGSDINFLIRGKALGEEAVEQIRSIFRASQEYARTYRTAIVSGFIGYRSAFSDILGVDSVLFDTVSIDTVQGQPHVYDVSISLVAFDKQQKKSELIDKTDGVDTSDISRKEQLRTTRIDSEGYESLIIEQKMRQMELYPDLELPTYGEVNRALPYMFHGNKHAGINKLPNDSRSRFVDPDWYVAYTETYRNEIIDAITNIGKNGETIKFSGSGGAGFTLKVPGSDGEASTPQFDENGKALMKELEEKVKKIDELKGKDTYVVPNINTTNNTPPASVDPSNLSKVEATPAGNFNSREVSSSRTYDTPFTVSSEARRTTEFISFLGKFASVARAVHLMPSIMIAQAVLETGWGKNTRQRNLFNIRPSSSFTKYWDGGYVSVPGNGKFRAYSSFDHSVLNYIELMSGAPRYKPVINATTYQQASQALMETGYCTDIGYTQKVNKLIKDYNLTQYDSVEPYVPSETNLDSSLPITDKAIPTEIDSNYTPDYSNGEYNKSDQWFNAVASGKCHSDLGDAVVNLTGISDIWNRNYGIYYEPINKSYAQTGMANNALRRIKALLEAEQAKNTMTEAVKAKKSIKEDECIVIKSLKDNVFMQIGVAKKADFEGTLWRHYPKGSTPGNGGPMKVGQRQTLQGMFNDMSTHDKRGRLVRAFPCFQMLLIDEGRWLSWYKMWDNFYGFNSIVSIDVLRSRKMAADTCVIEMTNIYSNIMQKDIDGKYTDSDFKIWNLFNMTNSEERSKAWEIFREEPTKEIIAARKEAIHELALKPGARLHLRMGYGSDAYELPIMFNGTITEADIQENATIIAQGDGIELTHKITNKVNTIVKHKIKPNSTNKNLKGVIEPRDTMCGLMTEYGGGWATLFKTAFLDGHYNPDETVLNISHFGQNGWLPPAAHPTAQAAGKILGGLVAPALRGLYGEQYSDAMEKLLDKDPGWLTEVYGAPWDNYGETGINIYRSAGIPSFSEGYYSQPVDENGNPVSIGAEQETKGDNWIEKAWYKMLDIIDDLAPGQDSNYAKKGDEPNLEVYMYDRSFWDVSNTFAKCIPDYICAAEPFEFRSTFFYGRPNWGLAYKYKYRYVYDAETDEIHALVQKAPRKTFMQYHMYYSFMDIINNKIRATSENMYTNVIVTYSTDNKDTDPEKQTKVIHADTDIFPENQKTAIVNIDLKPGNGIYEAVSRASTERANTAGVNMLKDFMKDMYDGELVMIGDPTIKPHDVFYLHDEYIDMHGNMGVKQVVHHLSYETGFITTVKPDAIVEGERRDLTTLMSLALPVVSGAASFWATKYTISTAWRKYLPAPVKELTGKALAKLGEFILGSKNVDMAHDAFNAIKSVSRLLEAGKVAEASAFIVANESLFLSAPNAGRFAVWLNNAATGSKGAQLLGKAATKMVGATALIETIGLSNIVSLVAMIAVDIIVSNAVENFATMLQNRQAVVLYPIRYQGLNFTAGITGSKGLVSGTEPGYWDKIFTENKAMQAAYAVLGMNPPKYEN